MLEDVIDLGESFSTNPKLGVGEPPFWRNSGLNFKIWPQISPPPRGLVGQFWYHAMRDLQGSLSSKPYDARALPEFLANFFPNSAFFGQKVQRLFAQNCPSLLRSNFAKWQHCQSCCLRWTENGDFRRFLVGLAPLKWPIILANYDLNSVSNSGSVP